MLKLKYNLDPNSTLNQLILQPTHLGIQDESLKISTIPKYYSIWARYGTVRAQFIFRTDATAIIIYNDDKTAENKCATSDDLAALIETIEKKGAIGGERVSNFLWAHENLKDNAMLKRIRRGAIDKDHPLEYTGPGSLLRPILKAKGDRYVWRQEWSNEYQELVDIAQYIPNWGLE